MVEVVRVKWGSVMIVGLVVGENFGVGGVGILSWDGVE